MLSPSIPLAARRFIISHVCDGDDRSFGQHAGIVQLSAGPRPRRSHANASKLAILEVRSSPTDLRILRGELIEFPTQNHGGSAMVDSSSNTAVPGFGPGELGALAHLYRGEVYRSTVWRTPLDATTNWAVVATGIALSLTFSSPEASPLPLVLVGLLIALLLFSRGAALSLFRFLAHPRTYIGVALIRTDPAWRRCASRQRLESDAVSGISFLRPTLHISFLDAVGRRLRRNYGQYF